MLFDLFRIERFALLYILSSTVCALCTAETEHYDRSRQPTDIVNRQTDNR